MVKSFYDRNIMPVLVDRGCGYAKVARQRALVVPEAAGVVVELGIGSGRNLEFYDPCRVSKVIGVDPSPQFVRLGRRRYDRAPVPVEVIEGRAGMVDLASRIADTVVTTYTLCSIREVAAALAEARRLLKPGGRLLFVEHGRAPDPFVARWQDWLSTVTERIAGGCRLDRNIEQLIWDAGYAFDRLEYHWVRKMPRTISFHYLGIARPR